MQTLNFDRTGFASIRLDRVDARRGVGHAQFQAIFHLYSRAPTAPNLPSLIHFSGEVRDTNGEHIADIRPATLPWVPNRPDDNLYLSAAVSFRSLQLLNDRRRTTGEDVPIKFALTLGIDGKHGWETQAVELPYRFAASDWLAFLRTANHASFAVVELPIDGDPVPAGLTAATSRYKAAIEHLRLCQWDDAIAECRQVLDDLTTPIGATEPTLPWADYANSAVRIAWTFSQRCAAIRAIIRHSTHDAHHGGVVFTADQARYVVDLTGVALKFYSERLRV